MKTIAIAAVFGALVTLFLWAIAFAVLNGIYQGNFPWLLTGLIAFMCPLAGGYMASRLEQRSGTRLGALSGAGAGLVVLPTVALASRLAPIATLAGILLVGMGALGGGLGAYLARRGRGTAQPAHGKFLESRPTGQSRKE